MVDVPLAGVVLSSFSVPIAKCIMKDVPTHQRLQFFFFFFNDFISEHIQDSSWSFLSQDGYNAGDLSHKVSKMWEILVGEILRVWTHSLKMKIKKHRFTWIYQN